MDDIPERTNSDHLHTATKIGLGFIPVVGGVITTLFETVFSAPIDKRKEEWLRRVAYTVNQLYEKVEGLTPEKLSDNPEFVSVFLQASNIAIRTHNIEKLEALNAAIKNTVLQVDLGESKKIIFLRIVDQMTPLHFKLLHFLTNPEQYVQELNSTLPPNQYTDWGDLRRVWDEMNKDIRSTEPLVEIAVRDLSSWGLIHIKEFHEALLTSVGTSFGRDFSRYVSS